MTDEESSLITLEEAMSLVSGSSKLQHSITTSRIMMYLAQKFGEPEGLWALVGLLHDLDHDQAEDRTRHGVIAAEALRDRLPEEALHAIRSHDHRTWIEPRSLLDKSLIFADSLAVILEDSRRDSQRDGIEGHIPSGVLADKPWIRENVEKFCIEYDVSIHEILEDLTV